MQNFLHHSYTHTLFALLPFPSPALPWPSPPFHQPRLEQKNLLVLWAATIQPEQRRELLWHAGQLVTSVHRGHLSRHDQQRGRRWWWRWGWQHEHEHGRRSGNQQQPRRQCLHHGQRWKPPGHSKHTGFPGNSKSHRSLTPPAFHCQLCIGLNASIDFSVLVRQQRCAGWSKVTQTIPAVLTATTFNKTYQTAI